MAIYLQLSIYRSTSELQEVLRARSFLAFWLQNVLLAKAACNFSTSELQKVVRSWCALYIFSWKCASRQSGVQFFDIGTSKSRPELMRFVQFQSENVLLATAACNFSTSELQKAVRSWCVLYIFTWKCASCHSGVQFLISPLTTWLRTRRFNEPTFRLTRHTNHWKNAAFCDFSNIWSGWIFFLLTFALLHLLSSDPIYFICFSTLHIVGSLLFKLPSMSSVSPLLWHRDQTYPSASTCMHTWNGKNAYPGFSWII